MRPVWLREPAAEPARTAQPSAAERIEALAAAVAGGRPHRGAAAPVVRALRPALSLVRSSRPPHGTPAPAPSAAPGAEAGPQGPPAASLRAAPAPPAMATGADEDDLSLLEPWERPDSGRRAGERTVERLVRRIAGARLAFGKPIRAGERTVVPVASFRAAGGGGFGGDEERGGGGGGIMRADPIGFIDIGADAARYRAIVDRGAVARAVVSAGVAGTALAVAMAKRSAQAAAEPAARRGLRHIFRRR